jgi:hypothetical protein
MHAPSSNRANDAGDDDYGGSSAGSFSGAPEVSSAYPTSDGAADADVGYPGYGGEAFASDPHAEPLSFAGLDAGVQQRVFETLKQLYTKKVHGEKYV